MIQQPMSNFPLFVFCSVTRWNVHGTHFDEDALFRHKPVWTGAEPICKRHWVSATRQWNDFCPEIDRMTANLFQRDRYNATENNANRGSGGSQYGWCRCCRSLCEPSIHDTDAPVEHHFHLPSRGISEVVATHYTFGGEW